MLTTAHGPHGLWRSSGGQGGTVQGAREFRAKLLKQICRFLAMSCTKMRLAAELVSALALRRAGKIT